jgi:photosystem II stability/assembly factor-like uncharacterized protein
MPIDDRLRQSMRRAAGAAASSPRAWASIERGIARRRRRAAVVRTGGAILAIAFVAALTWAGLVLRGHRQEAAGPNSTLVVTGVKVMAGDPEGPGVAKLYGELMNNGSEPSGASIGCSLKDANGNEVATTTSTVEYVEPHDSVAFGAGASYETAPVTATCNAEARPAVSPPPPEVPAPKTQLGGAAFFDAGHGIIVGAHGAPGCKSGCSGVIETTSDGGATWTPVYKTANPIVSVTALGSSDAWAVENETCAFICPALLHSSDGGQSWTDLGQVSIVNPSFVSPTVGFGFLYERDAMTTPLMKTTDGGTSWQRTGSKCDGPTAWGTFASFDTPDHGWVLCDGEPSAGSQSRTLYETADGGATLTAVPGDAGASGYPQTMFFRLDGTGWIGLGQAVISIMRTTDGGHHWTSPITIDANGGTIDSLWFLDDSTGYAVISVSGSPADRLIETTDGGTHWSTVHIWQGSD